MDETLVLDETNVLQKTWLCIIIIEPIKNTWVQGRHVMIIEDIDSFPVAMAYAGYRNALLKIRALKKSSDGLNLRYKSTVMVRRNAEGIVEEFPGVKSIFWRNFRSIPQKDWEAENEMLLQSMKMA